MKVIWTEYLSPTELFARDLHLARLHIVATASSQKIGHYVITLQETKYGKRAISMQTLILLLQLTHRFHPILHSCIR